MTHNKPWMKAKMGWLPMVAGIIIVASLFVSYLLLFNNQNTNVASMGKTAEERAADTEGVTYVINRDTLAENGQCHVKILQAIVKKNTVLLYFSLENHFKSNILDIIPYIIDLDNGGKIVKNSNPQQFAGTNVEPGHTGSLVGEFDYSVGASRHFKLGFRFRAKGMTADGDVSLPFDLK